MLQSVVQCIVDLKMFPNVRKEIMTGKKMRKYLPISNLILLLKFFFSLKVGCVRFVSLYPYALHMEPDHTFLDFSIAFLAIFHFS